MAAPTSCLRTPRSQPQQHPSALVYPYMPKHQLGNVRAALTEEGQMSRYPAATLEGTAGGRTLSMQPHILQALIPSPFAAHHTAA
ncbi:MAG TPA: hypothetical protein PKD90_13625 [Phnomibacter sp.]|nr:hypothetical protein [Phnomibacter sp.]